MAPRYLSNLVTLRAPNRHCLRKDNDFFCLQSPPRPHRSRTEGAFTFAAPHVWNELPYEIRCIADCNLFKKALKSHFFNVAFND